jgi:hypothetical protein
MPKQRKGFRLSEEAVRLLDALAAQNGLTQTSVLELAIRQMAKKNGIKLETSK